LNHNQYALAIDIDGTMVPKVEFAFSHELINNLSNNLKNTVDNRKFTLYNIICRSVN